MTTATLALLAALLAQAPSQPEPAKPSKPEPVKPQPKPAQPSGDPSLDELLGIPKSGPKPADKPADKPVGTPEAGGPTDAPKITPVDPAKAELERQLTQGEVNELFDQAVAMIDQSAVRLASSRDTGIDTQRMQEDAIRKLDTLIDQAKKQQSKSKSKSKPKNQEQQQGQQQQPQQTSQQNAQAGDGKNQGPGPARTEGALNAAPGGTAAWGNLPTHVRDALSQGKGDRYSSVYKTLTEKYYKRLAEEPKPGDLTNTPAPTPRPTPTQP